MQLSKDFRQKYLNTHESFLDAIWGILPHSMTAIVRQINIPDRTVGELREVTELGRAQSLKNMRNAWYHECAFCDPSDRDEDWLKFPPWKIIQFYYSIYCMLSAMVRCIDASPRIRHESMLDKYTKEFIIHPVLNSTLFVAPFCFYMDKGILHPVPEGRISRPYSLQHDLPNLKRCFDYIPNSPAKLVSLIHYFKSLREWANYEDGYIFMNLYGPAVREKLRHCLQYILPAFSSIGEQFLLAFWGSDVVLEEFNAFTSKMTTITKFEPISLQSRFKEYKLT